ncbi:hypothetical protein G7Y89_g607 [Cudoniella acicularis]|uniref:Uncharacterized protein n=1 Tax=Cudoniella acicularis TaxID=354080 RepID=A0A8H4RXU2_9HELO|nr:hypothetical protein G7Y89_g607 [Cudoniella acicularis]
MVWSKSNVVWRTTAARLPGPRFILPQITLYPNSLSSTPNLPALLKFSTATTSLSNNLTPPSLHRKSKRMSTSSSTPVEFAGYASYLVTMSRAMDQDYVPVAVLVSSGSASTKMPQYVEYPDSVLRLESKVRMLKLGSKKKPFQLLLEEDDLNPKHSNRRFSFLMDYNNMDCSQLQKELVARGLVVRDPVKDALILKLAADDFGKTYNFSDTFCNDVFDPGHSLRVEKDFIKFLHTIHKVLILAGLNVKAQIVPPVMKVTNSQVVDIRRKLEGEINKFELLDKIIQNNNECAANARALIKEFDIGLYFKDVCKHQFR